MAALDNVRRPVDDVPESTRVGSAPFWRLLRGALAGLVDGSVNSGGLDSCNEALRFRDRGPVASTDGAA